MQHSKLSDRCLWVASLICALSAADIVATERQVGPTRSADAIQTAQEVIKVFFPELFGRGYTALILATDLVDRPLTTAHFVSEFGFNIVESKENLFLGETLDTQGRGLLNVYCRFRSGQLDFIGVHGRAVHELDHRALRDEVDEHLEWTDAEVVAALRKRGALFGPDEGQQFKAHLASLIERAIVLGGPPRLESLTFQNRTDEPTPAALLQWVATVKVDSIERGGISQRFMLTFEPFEGKLRDLALMK